MYIEPNPTFEEIEEEIRVSEMVEEAMNEAENRATKKITHKWFATWDGRQQMVQYAYEIWGMDLVTLIEWEWYMVAIDKAQ